MLGLASQLRLSPATPGMWGWQLPLGTELSHGPSSMSCSIPAACPGSSSSGKLLSLWNTAGLGGGVSAHGGPACSPEPSPPSHHVWSFFKYGFYFEHLCDFSMEKNKQTKKTKTKNNNGNPRLPGCPVIVNYLNTFTLGIKTLCLEFASCISLLSQREGGRRSNG